jgi:hypothetical protein
MPTSANPPFRVSQYAPSRSYKAAFVSRLPQREVGISPDETPAFWRSGAMIIGPGYYDPCPPDQWRRCDSHLQLSSIASSWTRPERTALVDVHGRALEDTRAVGTAASRRLFPTMMKTSASPLKHEDGGSSLQASDLLSRSLLSRAPGTQGSTIGKASRWGVSRPRDDGLGHYYDSSHNTLGHDLEHRDNLRRYASSFTLHPGGGGPSRGRRHGPRCSNPRARHRPSWGRAATTSLARRRAAASPALAQRRSGRMPSSRPAQAASGWAREAHGTDHGERTPSWATNVCAMRCGVRYASGRLNSEEAQEN